MIVLQFNFHLISKPHPTPADESSKYEAWGKLTISITQNDIQETLLELDWNLDALVEAYIANAQKLCDETRLPVMESESLAQALNRLSQMGFDDEPEAEWLDRLYAFREIHALRLWLRGADIPWIVIGCNRGEGEISLHQTGEKTAYKCTYKTGSWAYPFGMREFQAGFHEQLCEFLAEWINTTPYEEGKTHAQQLLTQLNTGQS